MKTKATITGLGAYLPEKVLTNQDLERMVDTSDEWITTRTGMKERRIAAKHEFTSDMGFEAAKQALQAANLKPDSIDLILFATLTPDYLFPSTACLIQAKLEAKCAAAVDIQAACTGFIYALSMAKAYIQSGMYQKVLVVSSEKLSSIVDYQDRSTCVLFGDGAAACVVEADKEGLTIDHVNLGCDGTKAELIKLPAGGSKMPASEETVRNRAHYLQMEGREIYKNAVRRMEISIKDCMQAMNIEEEAIGWLIPHQANMRIIESLAKRFRVPEDRVFLTIHKYGNTSASSVGIALHELVCKKTVTDQERVMLVAFGAGLTFGAALLTYEGNQ
ncbi:MAG: beta-ketoacyl-ACP synthase III [Chlamydiota bacterium]